MSENVRPHESHEALPNNSEVVELQRHRLEELQHAAEQATTKPEGVSELQEVAAKEAISSRETTVGEQAESHQVTVTASPKELKSKAYSQSLRRIRERLPTVQRSFSRFIHQPTVDSVSNIGAKTVARPSGLLGGGLLALAGNLTLLYLTKHYGFTYNYLVFLLLFVVGFIVGSCIELVLYPILKRRRHFPH